MYSDEEDETPRVDGRRAFLRVLGLLGLGLLGLILGGAVLVPHAGRMADTLLHQTFYRQWTPLGLDADTVRYSLATPEETVQSYYSALYRGDRARMEALTAGDFRSHMQQRLAYGAAAQALTPYRSYVLTEMRGDREAQVTEKFHLFWQSGLRFVLRRATAGWQIVDLEVIP
ncbi:MAG: hypothetical protein AB7N91_01585 [Candidatus Tectimicrobiota bacterium]